MAKKNKLIVIMGYIGAGKDSIFNEIIKKLGVNRTISHTTRPKRKGEVNGREYWFADEEEFEELDYTDVFIEKRVYSTLVNDESQIWYYGLGKNQIDLRGGSIGVILDLKGTIQLLDWIETQYRISREDVEIVFIKSDEDIRLRRVVKRGDDISEVKRRMEKDIEDFKGYEDIADHIVLNNSELSDAIDNMYDILGMEKKKRESSK